MNQPQPVLTATRRDRITTVSLTIFCQSFQALSFGGLALLLPLIRQDLNLSFTQGGTLAAVTTLVYAFMQIPAGYLSDRYSPKRLFVIGILGSTILSLTLGLVTSYWQALVNQTFSGVFRALLFSPGIALITGWFPKNRRATATGLYLIGGATGSLVFNLVGPLLVAHSSWRFAFVSIASIGIIAILLLLKYGKDSPDQAERWKGRLFEALQLFRYKIMWVSGMTQFVRLGVMMGIVYWLPSLLVNEKGLPLQITGYIIAAQAILMAPGNIIGGYISDRLKNPILVIGISFAALGITVLLLINASNIVLVVALVLLNAIFLQTSFGPLFSVPVEVLGVQKAGIASGFSNLFANLGGFSATLLLGALKDASGVFKSGFLVISGACLAGLILTLVLGRIRAQAKLSTENP